MNVKKTSLRSVLLLLLATVIWGAAFVAQSVGMDYIGPFTFNTVRFALSGLCLIPVALLPDRKKEPGAKAAFLPREPGERRKLLRASLLCGLLLGGGSALQQMGMVFAMASKAGFLNSLGVIIVPFLSVVLLKKKLPRVIWLCALIAMGGLFCMSFQGGEVGLAQGDGLILLCTLVFSGHMIALSLYADDLDPVRLSCLQFLVCAALSAVLMALWEEPVLGDILAAWQPILYAGLLSGAVAYTIQTFALRECEATVASIIMSLESVFGVLFGALLLSERLSPREGAGCLLILLAVVLAQLPERSLSLRRKKSDGKDPVAM